MLWGEQNITKFTISFIDAGKPATPTTNINSQSQLNTATSRVDNAITSLSNSLQLNDVASHITASATKQFSLLTALSAIKTTADFILHLSSKNTDNQSHQAFLTSPAPTIALLPYKTKDAITVNANNKTINTIHEMALLNASAKNLATTPPASKEEAQAVLQNTNKKIDQMLPTIENQEARQSVRALKHAVADHINQQSLKLPQEKTFKPTQPTSSLVVANMVAGDDLGAILPTAKSITTRSQILDPSLVSEAVWLS